MRAEGVSAGAEGGVFVEHAGGRGRFFEADEPAEGGVDVAAGGDDDTFGVAFEDGDDVGGVGAVEGDHVDDDIRSQGAELVGVVLHRVAVAPEGLDAWGEGGGGLAAVKDGDMVAGCGEISHHPRTDEGGSAEDEQFHGWTACTTVAGITMLPEALYVVLRQCNIRYKRTVRKTCVMEM